MQVHTEDFWDISALLAHAIHYDKIPLINNNCFHITHLMNSAWNRESGKCYMPQRVKIERITFEPREKNE